MTLIKIILALLVVSNALLLLRNRALRRGLEHLHELANKHARLLGDHEETLGRHGKHVKLLTDLEAFDAQLEGQAKDIFEGMHTPGFQERFMALQEQRRLKEAEAEVAKAEREVREEERKAREEERRAAVEAEKAEKAAKREAEEAAEREAEEAAEREAKEKAKAEKKRWRDRWRELSELSPEGYDRQLRHALVDRLIHATAIEHLEWQARAPTSAHFGEFWTWVEDINLSNTCVALDREAQTVLFYRYNQHNPIVLREWSWSAEEDPVQGELFASQPVGEPAEAFPDKVRKLYALARDSAQGLTPRKVARFEKEAEALMRYYPKFD